MSVPILYLLNSRNYQATARLVGKPIGIFLDDKLLTAPVVAAQITGGTCVVSLNQKEPKEQLTYAKNLANTMKSGVVPVELSIKEINIISPDKN